MARGAPDWTQIVESGYAHYLDKRVIYYYAAVGTFPTPTEVVNVNIKGIFGWYRFEGEGKHVKVRLTIDGNLIMLASISDLNNYGLSGARNSWQKMSVVRFDEINNLFSAYYDALWGLAIHANLTVELGYTLGFSGNASMELCYKELI
jgi:hypothetical protein